MYLDKLGAEVSQGDIFTNLPFALAEDGQPAEDGQARIRRVRASLLTQDCEYDKPSTTSVLVAEILPISGVAPGSQGNIRKNRVAGAFSLPPHTILPESYADIRIISRVAKSLVVAEAQNGNRLLSLTEEARLSLQRQIAGFFGYHR